MTATSAAARSAATRAPRCPPAPPADAHRRICAGGGEACGGRAGGGAARRRRRRHLAARAAPAAAQLPRPPLLLRLLGGRRHPAPRRVGPAARGRGRADSPREQRTCSRSAAGLRASSLCAAAVEICIAPRSMTRSDATDRRRMPRCRDSWYPIHTSKLSALSNSAPRSVRRSTRRRTARSVPPPPQPCRAQVADGARAQPNARRRIARRGGYHATWQSMSIAQPTIQASAEGTGVLALRGPSRAAGPRAGGDP